MAPHQPLAQSVSVASEPCMQFSSHHFFFPMASSASAGSAAHWHERCLASLPLWTPGHDQRGYRSRVTYGSLSDVSADCIGRPIVKEAALCIAQWALKKSRMHPGFWRDVTVRASRQGHIHVKLLLQVDPEHQDLELPSGRSNLLEACSTWHEEAPAFVAHALRHIGPTLRGISCQVTGSSARPPKTEVCHVLYGDFHLREDHCGFAYDVGPETFSQINHNAADVLVATVAAWAGRGVISATGYEEAATIWKSTTNKSKGQMSAQNASTAAFGAARGVLVSGRDVNLFGAALFARTTHNLDLVTHCECAFADLQHNLRLRKVDGSTHMLRGTFSDDDGRRSVRANLIPKGARTAAHLCSLFAPGAGETPTITAAIVTAGRRGVGFDVCRALRRGPLCVLIYVYCCEATMLRDVCELTKLDETSTMKCWGVADALRLDSLPGTGLNGGALLLLRRPRAIILPVGPAGSGKSTLCTQLSAAFPAATIDIVERDAILASHLQRGCGMGTAKRRTHDESCKRLLEATDAGRVSIFDSCNANADGRRYYAQVVGASVVVVVSFEPQGSLDGNEYRTRLRERTAARCGHPTFPLPHEVTRHDAALDATIRAMQWPASMPSSTAQSGEELPGWHVVKCDSFANAEDVTAASVIERVFRLILWPVTEKEAADWSHACVDTQVVDFQVALRIVPTHSGVRLTIQ